MKKDIKGKIAVKLFDNMDLEDLCVAHIPGYDSRRFEIVAVRVFASKEFVVTIYAADKESNKAVQELRYPVKKFKIQTLSMAELFNYVEAFNFTVSDDEHYLEDMEITNK